MILELDEYIDRIAARTVDNSKLMKQSLRQRRDYITDMHGVYFTGQGQGDIPARFYVSISPDMVYLERFEFKLILQPWTQLSPTEEPVIVPVDTSGWRVVVDDIDVSPYLAAQYGGWIGGEGIYPMLDIDRNYDLLEVASDMYAEGLTNEAEQILKAGYKRIAVYGTSLFYATLVAYVKHSHSNR